MIFEECPSEETNDSRLAVVEAVFSITHSPHTSMFRCEGFGRAKHNPDANMQQSRFVCEAGVCD